MLQQQDVDGQLVGRREVLGHFHAAMKRFATRQGGALALVGEPGVGKPGSSRLWPAMPVPMGSRSSGPPVRTSIQLFHSLPESGRCLPAPVRSDQPGRTVGASANTVVGNCHAVATDSSHRGRLRHRPGFADIARRTQHRPRCHGPQPQRCGGVGRPCLPRAAPVTVTDVSNDDTSEIA